MSQVSSATVATAGAYVMLGNTFLFAIGPRQSRHSLAIYRLGGHREASETAWQCARREVLEEAGIHIEPMTPWVTYGLQVGENVRSLRPIHWRPDNAGLVAPLFVLSAPQTDSVRLSVMFLARTVEQPTPSGEVCGLIAVRIHELLDLIEQQRSLRGFRTSGGIVFLREALDETLEMEPLIQAQALAYLAQSRMNGNALPPS